MSYNARVLKVMLASPSDVSQERRVARDVVHDWNAIHAEDRGVALMPVGWDTHSSPEMGDSPQTIINKQVLAGCDLLVAIFWARLGSPTGGALSGTVEEIEEHLSRSRPAMIYFSSAPVRLDSVDSEQYSALLEFKTSCRSRGLIEEYDDVAAFREKFARQLAQTVIRRFAAEVPEDADAVRSQPSGPSLSVAACELLAEASSDPHGTVMRLATLGGTFVQANGREFVEGGDPRSEAQWRGAVDELQREGLVEDRTGKGELFFVTDRGYEAVDSLGLA